jgi:hypothetical protein
VYIVFLIDLASTTMSFADAYHWFAEGFGNLLVLDDIYLSGFDTPMLGSLLAATGQCYYCYRLWMLNRKTLPIGILVVLVCIFLMFSIRIKFVCADRARSSCNRDLQCNFGPLLSSSINVANH